MGQLAESLKYGIVSIEPYLEHTSLGIAFHLASALAMPKLGFSQIGPRQEKRNSAKGYRIPAPRNELHRNNHHCFRSNFRRPDGAPCRPVIRRSICSDDHRARKYAL